MEEKSEPGMLSPYSMRSVRRALGRKRCGELLILFVFMLFFYGPLLYSFVLAFANTYGPTDIIPSEFGFYWWEYVLGQPNVAKSIFYSFLFAFTSTAASLVICIPAAYVLARFKFKGRKLIMFSFLIGNAFPKIGIYTSMGIIYYKIGLMGTFLGVLLIHMLGTMMQMIWLPAGAFGAFLCIRRRLQRCRGWPGTDFFCRDIADCLAWDCSGDHSCVYRLSGRERRNVDGRPPQYRTMMTEMYGVILDYPATAGAVFAQIVLIPNLVLLFIMQQIYQC